MFNTLFKSIFNETQSEDRSAASVSVSLKDILAGTKNRKMKSCDAEYVIYRK